MSFSVPNKYRLRSGPMASDDSLGNNGFFIIPIPGPSKQHLSVIASDGYDWEHVSVSLPSRCPKWDEMNYIKDMFWEDSDLVIQIHPPKSEYVDNCTYCLHLWRKSGTNDFAETPPSLLVGIK